jgi:EAL domain-containing protein (putative c-di-GMP-specific phosphodiesterase class I)
MIKTVINMAHNLAMSITAEGIENEAQLKYLTDINCDFAQGYLTGQPCRAENLLSRYHGKINFNTGASIDFSRDNSSIN